MKDVRQGKDEERTHRYDGERSAFLSVKIEMDVPDKPRISS